MTHPIFVHKPGHPLEILLGILALLGGASGLLAGITVPSIETATPEWVNPLFNGQLTLSGAFILTAPVLKPPWNLSIERLGMGLMTALLLLWAVVACLVDDGFISVRGSMLFIHAGCVLWRTVQVSHTLTLLQTSVRQAADRGGEDA